MSKKYKIWVHLEGVDEEQDHYEDLGIIRGLGEFDDFKKALAVMEDIELPNS